MLVILVQQACIITVVETFPQYKVDLLTILWGSVDFLIHCVTVIVGFENKKDKLCDFKTLAFNSAPGWNLRLRACTRLWQSIPTSCSTTFCKHAFFASAAFMRLLQVADLESDRSKDMEYGERVVEMRREVEQLQKDYSEKCQECNMLQQRVGVLAVIERQHNECAAKIKVCAIVFLVVLVKDFAGCSSS